MEAEHIIKAAQLEAAKITEGATKCKEQLENEAKQILINAELEAEKLITQAKAKSESFDKKIGERQAKLESALDEFQKKKEQDFADIARTKKELAEKAYEYQKKLELLKVEKDEFFKSKSLQHEKEVELFEREKQLTSKEQAIKTEAEKLTKWERKFKNLESDLEKRMKQLKELEEIQRKEKTKIPVGETVEFKLGMKKETEMNQNMEADTFPNGMVGKAYHYKLDLHSIHEKKVQITEILGLEEIGLQFDHEALLIFGEPKEAGEKDIIVRFRFENSQQKHSEFLEKKFHLLMLPDPKSLWRSIDPPEDALFYKKNNDTKSIISKGGIVLAASKRGRSHAHEGIFRDDHFTVDTIHDNWIFLSVADGAGSAMYSREGSKISCEESRNYIRENINSLKLDQLISIFRRDNTKQSDLRMKLYNLFGHAIYQARNKIKETAMENKHSVKDYATTLILTLIKDYDFGSFVATYWVGDGAAAIYSKKNVQLLGIPDGGEFAGQTRFITMAEITDPQDIFKRIRFYWVSKFNALFLMTDGVSDPKFQTDSNLKELEYWTSLWNEIQQEVDFSTPKEAELQLLNWLNFWSQGNHDDRTIAILYK